MATRRLRSRAWFDDPANADMTALYLERYMNFGLSLAGAAVGQADHRHRADRQRSVAVQSSSSRACRARARRRARGRRHRAGVSGASDSGDRQAADRRPGSQSRLPRPGRGAVRLSARRRRADDRLRQDHAGVLDGRRDGESAGDRACRSARCSTAGTTASARARERSCGARASCSRPARSTIRASSSSSRRRRRRPATATRWALRPR